MKNRSATRIPSKRIGAISISIALSLVLLSACEEPRPLSNYSVSAEELEQRFGQIIEVANVPTPEQHGTGDKMGLFHDEENTFWGVPVSVGPDRSLVGCAPQGLEKAPVSDTLPSDIVEIVGATNEPTSWRGGTGELKLLVRTAQNKLRWETVKAMSLQDDLVCWSKSDPAQRLQFYRIVIAESEKKPTENSNTQDN